MRLSIFGLGHVGCALLKSFQRIRGEPRLVMAADAHGVFRARPGDRLDPIRVLERKLARDYDEPRTTDAETLFERARPEIHVELTTTDLETGEPAVPDIRAALDRGIAVVTSAKSHLRSIEDMRAIDALSREVPFLDHASQLAGIPATEMAEGLGCRVDRLEGVLNGSTNYMLKRMEEGARFEMALEEAQAKGFTERDWRYDVEGMDVAVKLVGLTKRLLGTYLDSRQVVREGLPGSAAKGISGITPEIVQSLVEKGEKLKLIGEVWREQDGSVRARVAPRVLPRESPFARIDGFHNAIAVTGHMNETAMNLFLEGPGAGADETASRVLGNLNHLIDALRWKRP
jgi:homoserine dehydrogenase